MGGNIDLKSITSLKSFGFQGFRSFEELRKTKCAEIPDVNGVYLVLRELSDSPIFLEKSIAGPYKGMDLSVSVDVLIRSWVADALILYIGKAGTSVSKQKLKGRVKRYVDTGFSQNARRKGGKLIWQLSDCHKLKLCWKVLPDGVEPYDVEVDLKAMFMSAYGKLPFANRL